MAKLNVTVVLETIAADDASVRNYFWWLTDADINPTAVFSLGHSVEEAIRDAYNREVQDAEYWNDMMCNAIDHGYISEVDVRFTSVPEFSIFRENFLNDIDAVLVY